MMHFVLSIASPSCWRSSSIVVSTLGFESPFKYDLGIFLEIYSSRKRFSTHCAGFICIDVLHVRRLLVLESVVYNLFVLLRS